MAVLPAPRQRAARRRSILGVGPLECGAQERLLVLGPFHLPLELTNQFQPRLRQHLHPHDVASRVSALEVGAHPRRHGFDHPRIGTPPRHAHHGRRHAASVVVPQFEPLAQFLPRDLGASGGLAGRPRGGSAAVEGGEFCRQPVHIRRDRLVLGPGAFQHRAFGRDAIRPNRSEQHQRRDAGEHRGRRPWMTPHPLDRAIAQRRSHRRDGQEVAVIAEVTGELARGAVAARRILRQGLHADGRQLPRHMARDLARFHGRRRRDRRHRSPSRCCRGTAAVPVSTS